MNGLKMRTTKWILLLLLAALLSVLGPSGGLSVEHPFRYGGTIAHHEGSATVEASGARPMDQAVEAVSLEYGWIVDYEDPPYQSNFDVGSIPWPAHPGLKWAVPASGTFESTYTEGVDTWSSSAAERNVLEKIVSDYNQSGNPGKFVARELPDGSFDVIGVALRDDRGNITPISPILDTPISLPAGTYGGMTMLSLITRAVSKAAGIEVDAGAPVNALARSSVTTGGATMSARSLLCQTVDAAAVKLVWELRFDPQTKSYGLAVYPAMRAQYDAFGKRSLVPVAMPRPAAQ